jgi:tryptophan synthase beta chain
MPSTYGDTAQMAPIVKMHTLGHDFMPAPIHAGGLRYHGMAPSLSALYDAGLIEAVAVKQVACFEAAQLFTQTEGILPAPESSHAIRAAIDEALEAKETGEKKTILFNLSGHGHFDLASYNTYLTGQLSDYEYPMEAINSPFASTSADPYPCRHNLFKQQEPNSCLSPPMRQGAQRGRPFRFIQQLGS